MKRIGPYLLFWSWNLVFLAFAGFGIGPMLLPELLRESWIGWVPAELVIWTLLAVLVPFGCAILALFPAIRRQPPKLVALLFAVEAPLFLLALVRVFAVREMNPGMKAVAFAVVISAALFLAEFWRPDPRTAAGAAVKGAAHAASLVLSVYLALWALFYAIPGLAFLAREVPPIAKSIVDDIAVDRASILLAALGLLLFSFSATLFAVLPAALPWLHLRALRRALAGCTSRFGRRAAGGIGAAGAVALIALFALSARQPQRAAFALLERAPGDEGERARLLARSDELRSGLVAAYLGSYRYAGAAGTDQHVAEAWKYAGLSEAGAKRVQAAYALFGWPIRYDGDSFDKDRSRAAELYESFFDRPIRRAERDEIVSAAASSFEARAREARLDDVGAERVLLARQELSAEEHGDWAKVELHEVYENQTRADAEVQYFFSLPGTAVVTGVWLGDTDDRTKRFPFAVAPRGAAQQVYREQVAKRADPALLEQVGPRQYRLRVFPVPARAASGDARRLHLWLDYQVLARDGAWPLPHLSERRNVYWTRSTERALGGAPSPGEDWLPASLPARSAAPPSRHLVALADGHVIIASPVDPRSLKTRPGLRLAVVLDTSRSMGDHAAAVATDFAWMKEALRGGATHLYVTASKASGRGARRMFDLSSFRLEDVVWFGALSWPEMLQQFEGLRQGEQYDAVALVTDDGMDPADGETVPAMASALWMVHEGGSFPRAYGDELLDLLSRPGSGVAASLSDVARRYSGEAASPGATTDLDDGYTWTIENAPGAPVQADPFEPFAARQLVLAMGRDLKKPALQGLDAVHEVAVQHAIVTPYSSMLVLVNDEQRLRLAELSTKEGRFQRVQAEPGGPAAGSDLLAVSGVPEPHEWALIGVSAAILALMVRRRAYANGK